MFADQIVRAGSQPESPCLEVTNMWLSLGHISVPFDSLTQGQVNKCSSVTDELPFLWPPQTVWEAAM